MDTRRRSAAKGLTWRALALADTVLLALIFTRSFTLAVSIGGIELVTKVFWYYLHERIWFRIPTEHDEYPRLNKWLGHDRQFRSVIKAVSWRFFGALDTFLITFLITAKFTISSSIGGTEFITKLFLYYLHDRAWSHIRWGKVSHLKSDSENVTVTSRLREATDVFRRHFHLSAAAFYTVACVLFVIISTTIIYGIHSTLATSTPNTIIQIVVPD